MDESRFSPGREFSTTMADLKGQRFEPPRPVPVQSHEKQQPEIGAHRSGTDHSRDAPHPHLLLLPERVFRAGRGASGAAPESNRRLGPETAEFFAELVDDACKQIARRPNTDIVVHEITKIVEHVRLHAMEDVG